MGIQGLLPFLKETSEPIHIRKYSGYTVAVDTYCWIHRGAVACASQLAKGEPADHYVRYCLKYVNMLKSLNIRPVMVFDGKNLPAKAAVEESRRERRENYSKKGRQFLREGKASEARDCFVKCINVTPEMALDVMKAVRSLDVDCIVAPYEADAQLAYLEKNGFVQAVITEDSDLIAFGCKKVIVKLDLAGNCLEVDSSRLNRAMKAGSKFTPDKFRYMCILAGCDYLSSLPGIGIGKARKLFQLTDNPDISQVVRRMATTLKMKFTVPPEYLKGFLEANNTFLYQLAFDPKLKRLQPLTPYTPEVGPSTLTYAGKYNADREAYQMALGNLNFNTLETMWDFKPQIDKPYDKKKTPRHMLSIWHQDYKPGPGLASEDQVQAVDRKSTRGKEVTVDTSRQKVVHRKRQIEDVEESAPPSDAQLSDMYANHQPSNHTQQMESSVVVPETPDKDASKPAKRNRFASKILSKKRANILKSGEVVTSRFFNSNKPAPSEPKKAPSVKEEGYASEGDKENHGDQLNNSGLLEGIADIEMEQERLTKKEEDEDDDDDAESVVRDENISLREVHKQTHVSKSLDALQRFQRSASNPILKASSDVPRHHPQGIDATLSKAPSDPVLRRDSQESRASVTDMDSSQEDAGKSWSQSSLDSSASSQRQGTPRPRGAFSWSRKKELQGKLGGGEAKKQSSLSSFLFRPSNQARRMPRSSSSVSQSSGVESLRKVDSFEMPSSQDSADAAFLPQSLRTGSMDMMDLEDNCSVESVELQSSTGGSQGPSVQSAVQLPTICDPPLPCLDLPSSPGGVESKVKADITCKRKNDCSNGIRRTGLSRKKRSLSNLSREGSQSSETSSPDTDAISLSQSSSPSPPLPSPPASLKDDPQRCGILDTGLSSLPLSSNSQSVIVNHHEESDTKNSPPSQGNSSKYFGAKRRRKQPEESEGSENTPPGRMQVSASPTSERQRNMTLLAPRNSNDQTEKTRSIPKSSIPASKKSSALLGQCKVAGLSKRRRPSDKSASGTPKGQTSLLAFMTRSKPKAEMSLEMGKSPTSPEETAGLCDLTPELEGSLLSRQAAITTKRNIFT
ncbi:uncharacterized protein [Diadema antillarum]|uniref:uncharacterized protein n=1 Tax=Diadema antillarum TaxID=105358 RepID=UPI003A8B09DE